MVDRAFEAQTGCAGDGKADGIAGRACKEMCFKHVEVETRRDERPVADLGGVHVTLSGDARDSCFVLFSTSLFLTA